MKNNFTERLIFIPGYKLNKLLPFFFSMLFLANVLNGYAQPTVLGTDIVSGPPNYITYDLNTVGGFKQYRIQALNNAVSGTIKWEFATGTAASTNYSTNWRPYTINQTLSAYNTFVDPATAAASARYNTGFGGQTGFLPVVTANNYYTFNITTNAAANNNMAVLETSYNPETISSVTQSPVTVGAVVSPTITVTMSSAPASNVYVRYSTNAGFTSSTIVQLSFVGATGTASIPAQAAGTNIYYYVYSSTRTKAAIDADVTTYGQSVHDMATLNLNNNAGANYSYTVLPVTVNATNAANDASYNTLKAAFDAINSGTHTGTINVTIGGNTTEGSSAVLNASGGSASYTSVTIKPSGIRTISGNLASPLVDLNGADNVTIDGLNDGTNTLTFINTSTSAIAGTCTIRMYNGTLLNTVQNCIVQGSTLSTGDGVISLGSGTNANLSIGSNTVRSSGANLPVYGVYSSGTNTSVSVSANNIQDYFSATVNSAGVYANTACNTWTISNNKFYQTAARTVTALGVIVRAIQVTAGGGHTISNNTIGFANSAGTGTTSYITNTTTNQVVAIELAGNTTASSMQGNIIAGMSITSASSAPPAAGLFSGIYVSSGAVNIGTLAGNTIGATTGTGSIAISCSATGIQLFISGIYVNSLSPNVVTIQNNNIGGINVTAASATVGFNFNAVYVPSTATASYSFADNVIGSTSTANSLNAGIASNATSNFTGISYSGTGNVAASGNTVQNCAISSTGVSTLMGIVFYNGSGAISIGTNNIISCSNASSGVFIPISNAAAGASLNISDNIIRSNSISSSAGTFTGISNVGAVTGAISINNNKLGNASGGLITFTVANSANLIAINNTGGTSTATLSIQGNDIRGITNNVQGTGNHTYILNSAATLSQTISTNTFTNLTANITLGGGSVTFISNSVSLTATGSKIIKDNAIVTSFTKTGGGSNIYFYFDAGSSVAGATITNEGNNFSNITVTGGIPVQGWFNTDGSGTLPAKNIFNNTFNNISANSSAILAIQITNGTGSIYGNTITNCSAPNTVTALSVTAGSFNIYSNTINTLSSSTSFAGVTGISISGGTTHNIYYHAIHSLSSSAISTTVAGIVVSAGNTVNLYKNKIYALSSSAALASGGVYGINVTGGTTITLHNNLIGNLAANAASFDAVIRGINIAGGTTVNLYYNTVHLFSTLGGTNFGSSALYTNTVTTLNLRNNILSNISNPFGTGKTVAFGRNGASFTNYAASSNNNLFYAGTPGASRMIFFDGTTGYQTLAAYQAIAGLTPRDNVSVTAALAFVNTTGSSLNFLHLNTTSAAESGAANIAGFTDDYDDEIRQGNVGYTGTSVTGPDIGADEFESVVCPATPTITGISSAAPYYAGDVITITGTNLSGITYATINDINVTIGATTATTADLTIPTTMADSVGVIQVAASSSCTFSNTFNFVFAGYITKGAGAGNGAWSTATIWRNNAIPVNNAPAIINTGDAVTLNVSADPIKFTILSGASLTHQDNSLVFGATYLNNTTVNGTLTVDNSGTPVLASSGRFISPTLVVSSTGTFTNNSANAAAVNIVNFYVNAGGNYNHNATGSSAPGIVTDFPGSSTRTFGNTSNVNITRWATAGSGSPINLPASGSPGWGNLTINVPTFTGSWNQQANLTNVQGNLNIIATGGFEFRLTNTTVTVNIGGNLTVSGGTFVGTSGTGNVIINVTGNTTVSGGLFKGRTGSGAHTLNVAGAMTVSSGTYTPATSSGATATTAVTGAFTVSGGTVTSPGSGHVYVFSMGSVAVSSGAFGLSSSSSSTLTLTSTGTMVISGTGSMASTSTGNITINCGGDYTQTSSSASAFQLQNGTSGTHLLIIGGSLNVSGAGLFKGGGSAADSIVFKGGAASVNYNAPAANMHTGGSPNVKNNFSLYPGKTMTLLTSILPTSSSTSNNWSFIVNTGATLNCSTFEIGTNAATPRTAFTLQTGATLKTANVGGVFGTTAGTASITTTVALASFSDGATYEFNGVSPQVTSAFTTTPTASTVANMVINNTAGVTLSAGYNVTAALQMQTGNLTLSTFNLTTASITGSPFSNTKMVVTNNTGALGQPVAVATILYPVGNSGQYTPASYTFTANSTARYLNVRAVTPRNVNDVSATDYINNRWWNTDLSVTTGTYAYTAVYTYISGDMVGTAANIRLNRWNGSAWVNDASSVVNNTNFTITSGSLNETNGTLAATAQWVGRVYVAPAIYHWTNTVNGSWLDQTKWTPTGVPGSGDGVVFDAAGGSVYTVTNMPTSLSLSQLTVSNNNVFSLSASGTSAVSLIFPGTATPQLNVASGSAITIDGTNAVTLTLPTNATGNIAGSLNLQRAAHKVLVTSAGALQIPSGGYFSYGNTALLGFTGNPFGATGTNGSVLFQNGSVCECFEGSNPFGAAITDKITTFQTGSLFRYSDPNVSSPSVSGRTYSNFTYNANKVTSVAAANSFICDSLTVTVGTFNLNLQGTPTPDHSIRGNINVVSGATLSFSPAAAGTVNLNSGATQIIRGAGTFNVNALATFDINAGTTASLQKSMGVSSTGSMVINGTLIATGENFISSPTAGGTVTMNNGSLLSVQSVDGISNAGIGNIRATNFTYNAGSFIYSGTSDQNTGNRLPATITGTGASLTIANTGTNPADIVTLFPNNKTTPVLNLNSGRFSAGASGELVIATGTLNGNGGNQYLSGTAADNIIRFSGNGVINGTPELYNVWAGGGNVDFVNNARINNIFQLNLLGAVVNHSPKYAVGSTLIYNNTGSYNRDFEWGSNTPLAPSYPHHVLIQNGTTVYFTGSTPAAMGCGGNLSIGSPSGAGAGVLDLSAVGAKNLYIGGNINIGGNAGASTLVMSNSIGGDIYLTGSWTRNAFGTVNFGSGNGRAIFFEGSTDATITANNGQTFPYVYITKSAKATKVTLADNVAITDEIAFSKGTVDLGTNNKFLTIVSTASKTGRIGQSDPVNTDFIYGATDQLGQFSIQRYMTARRSWRLMTAPLKAGGGTHSVSEAWQERGAPLTGLDYSTAGATTTSVGLDSVSTDFSTQITGGSVANGFDQSPTNNPSIKYYNAGSWVGPANINATAVNSQEGWMLFARGDRKNYGQITNQYKTPLTTTLRPRGQILIGSKSVTSTGLTVVGNPYASAIDYFTATKTGAGLAGTPTYYMWDPNMGGSFGTGAFVTLTWNGTNFTRSAPLTGTGTSSIDNRYIPSGAAIMVDFGTGGTLTFNETDKNAANTTVAFRPVGQLQTGLYSFDADGSSFVSDGTVLLFNEHASNGVDREDALKPANFSENFGIVKDGHVLSIERRKPVSENDTVFYKIANMKQRNYKFEFVMDAVPAPAGTGAFLEDLYLKKITPVSLTNTTAIDFSVTADAASAAKDRFRLVFKPTVVFNTIAAEIVNGDVGIQWQLKYQVNMNHYEIERSADGTTFSAIGSVENNDNLLSYTWIDRAPEQGVYYYRIKGVSNNGVIKYTGNVKVIIVKNGAGIFVYPNPVRDNFIQLQMSEPAGQYQVRLLSGTGQLVVNSVITHAGGVATHTVNLGNAVVKGVYNLEVTGANKKTELVKVVVE